MPDALGPASEFGGKVQRNRVQPAPHVPTPSERLMLLYTTGDESGRTDPADDGLMMNGLLPAPVQTALRQAEGVLEKGQEWERIRTEAEARLSTLGVEGEIVG